MLKDRRRYFRDDKKMRTIQIVETELKKNYYV